MGNNIIVTTNNLNNSNRNRREEDEKELPEVSTEKRSRPTARVKKEGFWSKFKRSLFGENVENVGEHMLFDVGIPALKATMADMVVNGIEVLLWGEARSGRRGDYRNYSAASLSGSSRSERRERDRRRITYEDISFDTKSDANEFLSEVLDYVKEYGKITIAVYSSILNKYTDEKIESSWRDDEKGWFKEDFRGVEPIRTRNGWDIDLPNPARL